MARPIWTGSLSFGLVNVPVKLMTAVRQKEVRFHLLHRKDGARIAFKRYCTAEDREVAYEDIVRGFELSPGRSVALDPEELEKLDPEATRTIEISDFVDMQEIDPIFYEHTYHLVPDRGAEHAYFLLLEAMRRTRKTGIARMVMRSRQYLCAVRPLERGLALSTMQYADEIVPQASLEELPAAPPRLSDRELAMAGQLIDSLTVKFQPEKYRDEYRERVLQLVQAKAQGREVRVAPGKVPGVQVVDLMDALKKSLDRTAGGRRVRSRTAARTARRPKSRQAK
jgi:DNA end-binding protein Ku